MQGCIGCLGIVLLGIAFIFASVVASLMGFKGGAMFVVALILLAGMIWIVVAQAKAKAKKEEEEKKKTADLMKLSLRPDDEFTPTHQYITKNGAGFIEVDESRLKVRIGGRALGSSTVSSKIIGIEKVLGVQVAENGKGIIGSDLSNTLGMAAVGGLVFGGAGAVVGAIAGQNAKTISDVSLVLAIDDLSAPFISLKFMTEKANRGAPEHSAALSEAQKWMGVINVLISRREKSKTFPSERSNNHS